MGFPGNQVGLVLAAARTRTLLVACDGNSLCHIRASQGLSRQLGASVKYLGAHRCDTASESGLLAHKGLGDQSHCCLLAAVSRADLKVCSLYSNSTTETRHSSRRMQIPIEQGLCGFTVGSF